jgi:hypothetical protein
MASLFESFSKGHLLQGILIRRIQAVTRTGFTRSPDPGNPPISGVVQGSIPARPCQLGNPAEYTTISGTIADFFPLDRFGSPTAGMRFRHPAIALHLLQALQV